MNTIQRYAFLTAFIERLAEDGWQLTSVKDEEDGEYEDDFVSAIMDLGISWLTFYKASFDASHTVMIIPENGEDMVSDWSFTKDDPDGFDRLVSAYLGV